MNRRRAGATRKTWSLPSNRTGWKEKGLLYGPEGGCPFSIPTMSVAAANSTNISSLCPGLSPSELAAEAEETHRRLVAEQAQIVENAEQSRAELEQDQTTIAQVSADERLRLDRERAKIAETAEAQRQELIRAHEQIKKDASTEWESLMTEQKQVEKVDDG